MSNFVSVESNDNTIKLQNLMFTAIFIGFTWIVFHFTVVFFFGLVLESVFLVGLFLGIGNIVAMLLDIPVGVLQKYIKPKTFLLIASSLLFFVSLIFVKFIYFQGIAGVTNSGGGITEKTISYLGAFLNSGVNIFLLLLAAALYGIIKESFDVTTLSYIFNISTPGEYASLISKYNIYSGIGSMVGLIFSGILLAFNIKIAIIIFSVIIMLFMLFISKYFDNSVETFEFEKVKNLKLDVLKTDLIHKKNQIISKVTPSTIVEISKQSKVILLKPIEIKKSIDFKEVYNTAISGFETFGKIIFGVPRNLLVLWFLAVILQYGFWDTFVSTFQIEFLEKIIGLNQQNYLMSQLKGVLTGYVLLGLLVVPAFLLQDFFINISKKFGEIKVIMFGLLLSSISLFFFGIFTDIFMVILFGLLNSVGYAASMPLAQALFSGQYNEEYAKKFNLKEIDTTVSAAPLKIVLNFANVIGLLLGAALVGMLGFDLFFMFFSLVLGGCFVYTFLNFKKLFGTPDTLESQLETAQVVPVEVSTDSDFQ